MTTDTRSPAVQALLDAATRLPGWLHRHAFYSRQEAARRPEVAEHAYAVALYAWELASDPPPMKWSALWYGFEPGGRIDVEEATQA